VRAETSITETRYDTGLSASIVGNALADHQHVVNHVGQRQDWNYEYNV